MAYEVALIKKAFKAGTSISEGNVVSLSSSGLALATDVENVIGVAVEDGSAGQLVSVAVRGGQIVKVLFDNSNGSVSEGSQLTLSNGKAAKRSDPSSQKLLGIALESASDNGLITALIL